MCSRAGIIVFAHMNMHDIHIYGEYLLISPTILLPCCQDHTIRLQHEAVGASFRSFVVRITPSDYNIKLSVRNATRAESGTYTLTATNENGTDSADVLVTVLGTSGQTRRTDGQLAGTVDNI